MESINRELLAEFVQGVRNRRNLSQKALALLLKTSQNAVYAWENSVACPSVKNLSALATLEGLTLEQLMDMLTGAETMERDLPTTAQEVLPYIANLPDQELLLLARMILDKVLAGK